MTARGVFDDAYFNATCVLSQSALKSVSGAASGTLLATSIANATENYVIVSGGAGITLTTDTAANIIAQLQNCLSGNAALGLPNGIPNLNNISFFIQIVNNNSGTVTVAGGTGVTVSGTATIATNTSRQFLASLTGPATITLTNVGSGTN